MVDDMTENIRAPDAFGALLNSLQVLVYERTGVVPSRSNTILLFLEVAVINQKKLANAIDKMPKKPKTRINTSL
jgi:hypothetical protein